MELSVRMFPDSTYEEMYVECEELLKNKKEMGYLYLRNNKIVAFMNISIRNDYVNGTDTSPVVYIEALYVLPECRRQGIAGELIKRAEEIAKNSGITQLASDCLLENTISEQFHKSCGFSEAERVICFVKNV